MLKDKVIKTIKTYNLIESGDKLVLGVSGGPDSISMLKILTDFKNEKIFKFDFVVAHINHGLRENAKIDEKFVKDYCDKNNIEFYVCHADIKKEAERNKKGLEETGRDIRYEFFNKIKLETNSNKIAIAHNSNDRAETVIMNLLRGARFIWIKRYRGNKRNIYKAINRV